MAVKVSKDSANVRRVEILERGCVVVWFSSYQCDGGIVLRTVLRMMYRLRWGLGVPSVVRRELLVRLGWLM